jgi:double-stranded uracil-DNA glycosylase
MPLAKPLPGTKYSFPPFADANARLLILGTLPGDESLRLQQYYGHPRNHFWPLIAALVREPLPTEFLARKDMLKRHGIALWDVLEGAERIGSSDAAIRNPTINAFKKFFADYLKIKAVAFNGQKARELFRRYVIKPGIVGEDRITAIDLPSSSPLYTASFEDKLSAWREKLDPHLPLRTQKRRAK